MVGGDEDVGKGEQTRQHVVLQHLIGQVAEEEAFLLLVDIQPCRTHLSRLQGGDG